MAISTAVFTNMLKERMELIEKPDRVDRIILKAQTEAKRRRRRLFGVKLNPVESRIFWEDLIEDGLEIGDPADDSQYEAFVGRLQDGVYEYKNTRVKLNVEGV